MDAAYGSRGAESPCDEGQASLGEALETVHTCRLLPQPYSSESCVYSPPQSGDNPRCSYSPVFFNIIQHSYCQGLCTAVILCTLLYSEKNTVNRYKHRYFI